MKFGKSLSNQIEDTLPEWKDKFLSYKELKKRLKLIEPRPVKRRRLDGDGDVTESMTEAEAEFVRLLEDELEKFNSFFVEQEEEYIIRLKELQDRLAIAMDRKQEMIKIRKEVVDFHGEMVLLENYSALNYTGVVKILKKYDKRTGALLRLPFIQKVLQQPFFTTDLLYKLVKECETMLDQFFELNETVKSGNGTELETEYIQSLYMKSSISALRVLQEIRSKSSTVSEFSLPPLQMPLQISALENSWNQIPVVEQVAE